LEVLGDRWSLIVIRDVMFRNRRHYRTLLNQSEEGIASNVLADRLKRLTVAGLLSKVDDPSHRQKAIYNLTEPAIQLVPLLVHMADWGVRHTPASEEHAVGTEWLLEGGPPLWTRLMQELRHLHLDVPAPSRSILAELHEVIDRTRATAASRNQPAHPARALEMETTMTEPHDAGEDPARLIDAKIAALGDWRGETLARMRALIKEADPNVTEAIKWRKPSNPAGVPVWEHAGIICTGDAFKNYVKLTFAKGALLSDPAGLFNASLKGNTMRAIDIREGEEIDAEALKALIREAVALNSSRARSK